MQTNEQPKKPQTPEAKEESPHLMQPGVGSGVALFMLAEKLVGGVLVGGTASAVAGKGETTGGLGKRFRYFLRGFGLTTMVSSLYNNGFRLLGGVSGGDRTLAGDGVAGLTGDLIAVGVAGAGLGVASLMVPITAPIVVGTLGIAVTVGALSGHIARDTNPKFRHFTDDVVAHDIIIKHTPEAIKGPGSRLYKAIFNGGKKLLEPVMNGARNLLGLKPPAKPEAPEAPLQATPAASTAPAAEAAPTKRYTESVGPTRSALQPCPPGSAVCLPQR